MNEYKINDLPLAEVFNAYLDHNGLTVAFAAKSCDIPYTNLLEWSKGMRGLSLENAHKIHEFLRGKYVVDVNVISTWLKNRKEDKLTDSEKPLK